MLLPFDIAVRRLIITRSDLRRARAAIFGDQQAAAETVERMAALKTAKARANVDMPVSASSAASNDPSLPAAAPASTGSKPPRPAPAPAAQPSTSAENKNVAGELLRRRKDKDRSA